MNKCPHCQSPPVGWLGFSISEPPSQRHPYKCRKCGGKSLLPKPQSWLLVLLTLAAALGVAAILRRLKLSETVRELAPYATWLAVVVILPKPLFRLFFKLQPVVEGVWVTRNIRRRRLSWILSMVCVIWAIPSISIGRMMWTGEIPRHVADVPTIAAWVVVGLELLLLPLTTFCWFMEKPTEKPKEVFVPNPSPNSQHQNGTRKQTPAKE